TPTDRCPRLRLVDAPDIALGLLFDGWSVIGLVGVFEPFRGSVFVTSICPEQWWFDHKKSPRLQCECTASVG
ncbi:MAG: hypothetical protein K2H92_05955, partial [Bacteroidaceae bacterium]|nr:hypothetical protein [Bacteroidaceae bacterium]